MTSAGRIRRILAAPVAAVVAVGALAAGGGLALAASYGKIDVPFVGQGDDTDHGSDGGTPGASGSARGQTQAGQPGKGSASGRPTDHPTASPAPSFVGLCHAFQAGAYKDDKKSPSFLALAHKAGGADQIAGFCTDLIGTPKPAPTHKPKPTQAGQPGEGAQHTKAPRPTSAATPTHKAKPTTAATPTQTGKPTKTPKH